MTPNQRSTQVSHKKKFIERNKVSELKRNISPTWYAPLFDTKQTKETSRNGNGNTSES